MTGATIGFMNISIITCIQEYLIHESLGTHREDHWYCGRISIPRSSPDIPHSSDTSCNLDTDRDELHRDHLLVAATRIVHLILTAA